MKTPKIVGAMAIALVMSSGMVMAADTTTVTTGDTSTVKMSFEQKREKISERFADKMEYVVNKHEKIVKRMGKVEGNIAKLGEKTTTDAERQAKIAERQKELEAKLKELATSEPKYNTVIENIKAKEALRLEIINKIETIRTEIKTIRGTVGKTLTDEQKATIKVKLDLINAAHEKMKAERNNEVSEKNIDTIIANQTARIAVLTEVLAGLSK